MKQYEELLKSETGRGQLQDLLSDRLRHIQPKVVNEAAEIPLDRVVSCADHRNDGGYALEQMKQGLARPIQVSEARLGSCVYYMVSDGNHRAEAARALGHKTIQAKILQRTWLQERAAPAINQGLER